MYVNAALNAPGKLPGQYPSAGPLPHLFDIWKIGAPAIDFLAVDSYWPDFTTWARKFRRDDNPLFVPEANHAGRPEAVANAFFVFGELDAIGFSPFSIEDLPENDPLIGAYAVLDQLAPLIIEHQGKTGDKRTMRGFKPPVTFDGTVDQSPQSFDLGGYRFTVTFVDQWTPKDKQVPANHGGLVIQTGKDEFVVAGTGVTVTFADAAGKSHVGMEQVVEGAYKDGLFLEGRWLNGDQTHQGRHLRLPPGENGIQRLRLYRYD
jgi:beta-galactosidase GanA